LRVGLALASSAGVLLAGCGTHPSQTIDRPVKDLVLTVGQIPYPGFQVETGSPSSGTYSNQRAAAGSKVVERELARAGRITGYESDFERAASPQEAIGPVVIESSAASYRTDSGAAQGLRIVAEQARTAGGTQISTGSLGDGAVGFVLQKQFNGTSYEAFVVAWRQANVVAGIQIEGNAATLDVGYAITLAERQQHTIEAS
jgi:hypothetical protein